VSNRACDGPVRGNTRIRAETRNGRRGAEESASKRARNDLIMKRNDPFSIPARGGLIISDGTRRAEGGGRKRRERASWNSAFRRLASRLGVK